MAKYRAKKTASNTAARMLFRKFLLLPTNMAGPNTTEIITSAATKKDSSAASIKLDIIA